MLRTIVQAMRIAASTAANRPIKIPLRVLTKAGLVEDHPANPILKEIVGQALGQKGLTETTGAADLQVQTYLLSDTTPQLEAVILGMK